MAKSMAASKPELIVAERIIELLETADLPPWRKPWKTMGLPRNAVSDRPYNGINRWLLLLAPYGSSLYVTYKQATALGGTVKKGEKGWPVVFWKFPTREEQKKGKRPFCRYYTVFNLEQCEDIDLSKIPGLKAAEEAEEAEVNPIEVCEALVNDWTGKPKVEHGGSVACYSPVWDQVKIPPLKDFNSAEEYYSTLFHELVHSTGHANRLNREAVAESAAMFGSHDYSQEELVAEFGAAQLCADCGIETATLENSAAYIKGWHKRLKNDPECLVLAARQANKACRMIHGTDKADSEAESEAA